MPRLNVSQKIVGAFACLQGLLLISGGMSLFQENSIRQELQQLHRTMGGNALLEPAIHHASNAFLTSAILIGIIQALAVVLAILTARHLVRPIQQTANGLSQLIAGRTDFELPQNTRTDELGAMLDSLGTLKLRVAAAYRLERIVESMPMSVLITDPSKEGMVCYANPAALSSFGAENLDGRTASELFGEDWKIFSKRLKDPENLPMKGEIHVGGDLFKVEISALTALNGTYAGPMIIWQVATRYAQMVKAFEDGVGHVIERLGASADALRGASSQMSNEAEQMVLQARTVATSADTTSSNVQSVAAATEEMTGSIAEIGRQVQQSTHVVATANQQTAEASKTMNALSDSAKEIGEVVDLIVDIAEQTSLLALNATIEAAAAGDAGRGFAVVAHEVKNLASETAKATEIISGKISDIQSVTRSAVQSIESISRVINELQEIATTISSAIEQQTAATREISASIAQASSATIYVNGAIGDISESSSRSGQNALQVLQYAQAMNEETARLQGEVNGFLEQAKSA